MSLIKQIFGTPSLNGSTKNCTVIGQLIDIFAGSQILQPAQMSPR